ncbi:MAG: hypothetical protein FJ137_09845 [Deltaproteobacteria bacterium]|nr:hypothetical protein [Deltaproteobacteria bacterium]
MNRRVPSPRTRAGQLAVVTLGLSAVAADCQQCQPPPPPSRGNLDRVADVVLVDALDGHGYAIAANPELEHLRVLDLTDGRFVVGPNRFFPLSVPTGPSTRQLATAVVVEDDGVAHAEPRRVFALDTALNVVQVVNVVDDDAGVVPFSVAALLPTGRAPVDVAALVHGDVTTVAVAVPGATDADGGQLELSTLLAGAPVDGDAPVVIPLPAGSHPTAVVADPLGRAFVVADGLLPQLHVVERADNGGFALVRSLDLGAPTSALSAGVVDIGDGLAPVVVALGANRPAIFVARLFRPGFREDRYAVLGGAALPALGLTAAVADARPGEQPAGSTGPTVCCRGLSADRVAAGEATAAFAAVHQADGALVYVQLAAARVDDLVLPPGRWVVRLVDDDAAGPQAPDDVDLNADPDLWVPAEGGEALRPVVALATVDNFGSPPVVALLPAGAALTLTWEGDLPGLTSLRGAVAAGSGTFNALVDVGARDGRAGDVARLAPSAPLSGCDDSHRARILAVDGATVAVAVEGDGTGAEPALSAVVVTSCLQGAGDVRLSVEAQGAFVVTGLADVAARLLPVDEGEPDVAAGTALPLPGAQLTVTTPAGRPRPGSALRVPLDPHVTTLGLDLSAAGIAGGFGQAGLLPTGLAIGTIAISDASSDDTDAVIDARRMVLSTASTDTSSGLPLLFTGDEAETSTGRIETFR